MQADDRERQEIQRAVRGDQVALQQLLVLQAPALARYVASRLPEALRGRVDVEDVVQQAFVEAFRSISRYQLEEGSSFQAWLIGITAHVLKDAVKRDQRQKRGGQFRRVHNEKRDSSESATDLVQLLTAGGHSPSQSVMGHEAAKAVHAAIDALPDDYRQAVELRLLQGRSLDETAALMNRSPRAVQGLIDRAKKQMRAALGRLSKYG